jgi:hypothetical protein
VERRKRNEGFDRAKRFVGQNSGAIESIAAMNDAVTNPDPCGVGKMLINPMKHFANHLFHIRGRSTERSNSRIGIINNLQRERFALQIDSAFAKTPRRPSYYGIDTKLDRR